MTEAHHRALFETALDGVLITEPAGRILAANPSACRLLGRTETQLQALTRVDLVKPGDRRLAALLAERERTGRYQGELTLLRPDGVTFEAEVASVVTTTEHGPITTMIIRDISERHRALERIREQAQWLDKTAEGIFVTDLEHRIVYWNQGAERICGWSAIEVIGQSVSELLLRACISDPAAQAAACQMNDWRGTISCCHSTGRQLLIATSATVLRDEQNRPTGRIVLCADITEQTRLQEKYERALRLQSLGMLAAGVVHDFNNILTPIGLVESMLRERLSQPDDREMLETIRACVSRGAIVSRQILGFAQGMGNETRPVDLQPVLREVAAIVRETFPRSIALEEDVPADLWPVIANPTQVHQLLLNLCVNARDAMPNGGRLRLGGSNKILDAASAARIDGARVGAWAVLVVTDTGNGITADLLPRIWEPFFTTKPGDSGTGLGLDVVRAIVERHSGFISVETKVGCGTSFRVFLPSVGSKQPNDEAAAPVNALNGNGETIMLADDEACIREAAKVVLTRAGYRVVTATNGAQALAEIKQRPQEFDLVLTDIDMPELDGTKLAIALAALRPELKVMAMSGLGSRIPGVNPGLFTGGLLPKPFTMDRLLGGVRQALEGATKPDQGL